MHTRHKTVNVIRQLRKQSQADIENMTRIVSYIKHSE
jgi:hypothetical protein